MNAAVLGLVASIHRLLGQAEGRAMAASPIAGTRRDYLGLFPGTSTATASRDLAAATERGELARRGDKALARYGFVR